MKIVFDVEDVLGKKIFLTGEALEHVLEKPEMLNQEERIKNTLEKPK